MRSLAAGRAVHTDCRDNRLLCRTAPSGRDWRRQWRAWRGRSNGAQWRSVQGPRIGSGRCPRASGNIPPKILQEDGVKGEETLQPPTVSLLCCQLADSMLFLIHCHVGLSRVILRVRGFNAEVLISRWTQRWILVTMWAFSRLLRRVEEASVDSWRNSPEVCCCSWSLEWCRERVSIDTLRALGCPSVAKDTVMRLSKKWKELACVEVSSHMFGLLEVMSLLEQFGVHRTGPDQ